MDELKRKYTVLLVEDSGPVEWAVKDSLSGDEEFEYLGVVIDRHDLEQYVAEYAPDLIIIDIQLPETDTKKMSLISELSFDEGLWMIRRAKQLSPQSNVIAFSNFFMAKAELASRALRMGADALLSKQNAPSDRRDWSEWFRYSLRSVVGGYWMPDAVVAELLVSQEEKLSEKLPSDFDKLSDRELSVLRLKAEGKSDTQIADILVIEPTTVRSHIRNILSKLHARSRKEAIERFVMSMDQGK